ncbi:hypothetical protein UlMin_002114 [Ulmus minor]
MEKTDRKGKPHVWDCGSTLYDSFELNSFKRQLDSAISCRTLSMPHLSDRRAPVLAPPPPPAKKSSKLSRSLNKLLRSVFRPKPNSSPVYRVQEQSEDGFFVVYDKSGSLTTIPEVPEIDFGGLSPEIGSLVRRTGSERFPAASLGISCA